MKLRKVTLMVVMLFFSLFLQGCVESEADKQAASAKKHVPFQNMQNRGRDERYCDFLHINLQDRMKCWTEKDTKWKDVPSAYVGEPPAGVERSSKKYEGTDGPIVPKL